MISRSKLDLKRLNYYENLIDFNNEFDLTLTFKSIFKEYFKLITNSVLIVRDGQIDLTLQNNNVKLNFNLKKNESISLIQGDTILITTYNSSEYSADLYSLK